ncbi:MAG: AAA family ATPase [Gaiella sp.]|nr:AAA family ATPase [Gaiella sp.]
MEMVGRAPELDRIETMLAAESPHAVALVLEGAPGIGKTTLWRAGIERATASSRHILRAQPAENEGALPFAGLADVLDVLGNRDLGPLADADRTTLETLRRGDPAAHGLLTTSRAVLALVRALASGGGAILAIDDVQWLDQPSAGILEYVLRRSGDVPLRVLLTRRTDVEQSLPLGLERVAPGFAVERLVVPPMGIGELDDLVRGALGLELPRTRLAELLQVTGGNPFYALEIARPLGSAGPDTPLHVPESLGSALEARVDSLPPAVRQAVLLASATPQPSVAQLEAVAGAEALRAAIDNGILVVDGPRLRFTHPLLAAVAYGGALPSERRAAHLLLADAARDTDERAFHLARGTVAPDDRVASALEDAAASVAARGDPRRAAELAEAAARLTPADDRAGLHRRRLLVTENLVAAGDPARARALLEAMIGETGEGPGRAALLWRLADTIGDTLDQPIGLCEQALREAGDDPALLSDIHTALGTFTWLAGDLARSTGHVRSTSRHSRAAGDELREAIAIGEMCHAEAVLGVPWDRVAMERALAIERRLGGMPATLAPSFQLAVISVYTDEHDTARPILLAALERAVARGDEPARATSLFRLTELELRAGRFGHALSYARDAAGLARQAGIEQEQYVTTMALSAALAHVAQLDEARELATRAHAVATAAGDRIVATRLAGVLGFVELSDHRSEEALAWLVPGRRALEEMGTGELSISGIVQNQIEALVALDRLEEADAVIRFTEERGAPTGRAWHQAVAARGRALVAAGRGDTDAALEALARAYAAHERLPQPFELARTRLVEGRIERRAKRRGRARVSLTAALESFDALGAGAWAGLAASELARLPGRRPAPGDLSETERRVAELVAAGHTNREVAATLFVTVRTVESNLTRVYGKLGIRSRTELVRRLGDGASV